MTNNISNEIYAMKDALRPFVRLYGDNYFLTSANGIMKDIKEYAKAAVLVAKTEIPKIARKYGYLVEFDGTCGYPDKIVFRREDCSRKKEGFPDYFRIDSFSNTIID